MQISNYGIEVPQLFLTSFAFPALRTRLGEFIYTLMEVGVGRFPGTPHPALRPLSREGRCLLDQLELGAGPLRWRGHRCPGITRRKGGGSQGLPANHSR